MRQQTAVDFLHCEYKRIFGEIKIDVQDALKIADSLEKANEMFEQQIIDAHLKGQREDIDFINEAKEEAEQYYKETFKSE